MTLPHPHGRANIINFIRFDHGMATVEAEMWEILKRGLPATWLLQYDALAAGPYVDFLKANAARNHEVGLWFEVNRRHCQDAEVPFDGEIPETGNAFDTENWSHHARAMMSCGYTQKERIRLIDTMMQRFHQTFGRFAASVAAWYIDSFSLNYLWEKYHIAASANCKEQWDTDGYTLWGAPYRCFYYPAKANAMMAAPNRQYQIHVPIFRLLGNDPVNARNSNLRDDHPPVNTLEPAYPQGGGNAEWVRRYFDMILDADTRPFAYFQIGQENGFNWDRISKGYRFQLDELIRRRDRGELVIETLEETGRFAQAHYPESPVSVLHAKANLLDLDTRAVWYRSKNYRVQVLYSDHGVEIVDLYRYAADVMERFYQDRICTWNALFMAQPVLDTFLFGSRWHLTGTMPEGQSFDERDFPISDVATTVQGDTLILTYRNAAGVRSRLTFFPEGIQADRESEVPMTLAEQISFDPKLHWSPILGTYHNQIVLGWNNYDYRVCVKERLPVLDRGQGHIHLGTFIDQTKATTTLYVFPCVSDSETRKCRE